MSKTVIVFSTRFITPHAEDCLFSKANSKRKTFSSKQIVDFFWNDIKNDNKYVQLVKDYLKEDDTLNELVRYIESNKTQLEDLISKYGLSIAVSPNDFGWIEELLSNVNEPLEDLTRKYYAFNKGSDSIINESGKWIADHIKDDSSQQPFNIDDEASDVEGPWLLYRFSYYELNSNTDDVKVYAVWPLAKNKKSLQKDGEHLWVDALTDQFLTHLNPTADKLYLILHDDDIEKSIFKVLEYKKDGNLTRYIALFQHVDAMGAFLNNPRNNKPEIVKENVERMVKDAHKRKLLRDACDYITCTESDKSDHLLITAKELHELDNDKFRLIHEIAEKIKGCEDTATEQYIDCLKLELISQLNQQFINYMNFEN